MAQHEREPLALVAALTPRGVIGKDGSIPWHHPEDLKHFRRVTKGHAVIMGRATYDSIGKPLKERLNIVVSRNPELRIAGCEVVPTFEGSLALARMHDSEPRVIGGAQLYALALPLATQLLLTHLDEEHEGDVYFPPFDASQWVEVERRSGPGLSWVTLRRA